MARNERVSDRTLRTSLLQFGSTVAAGMPLFLVLLVFGAVRLARQEPERLDAIPPEPAIVVDSERGRVLVEHAEGTVDLIPLQTAFVAQRYGSFCGVASGVAAVNALRPESAIDQESFFTEEVQGIRSYWATLFLGMTRDALAEQLDAHGLDATSVSAREGLDALRAEVVRNLSDPDDVLLANYDRRALGQVGGGHISPIAAWDADTERVLVLDTAAYKYPAHWLPLDALYRAMDTNDPETGARRGWVTVRRAAER
jgi:hypothetical protein